MYNQMIHANCVENFNYLKIIDRYTQPSLNLRELTMNRHYAYSPSIWPSLLTVFFLLAMAYYSSRHRSVPGVFPYFIALLFASAWAAGSVMEYAAVDLEAKIFWVKFQTAWQLPSVTAVTCFALEYAWPGRWVTRRNLAYLSIAPILVLGLIITDPLHHFLWLSFRLDGSVVTPLLGPAGWMAIIYSFGLVILSFIVLTWLFLQSPQHRLPVVIMVIGHIGVRGMYMLEKANPIHPALPLDVLGLAFMVLMYAIALFGFRLFEPIPLASQTLIAQLREGMLVLDPKGRVTSLNPAAERILGTSLKRVQGKPIREVLPKLPELNSLLPDGALTLPIEMNGQPGVNKCCYELTFYPLNDFRGLPIGHLLLLHDVTEQRRSQAQILEQQRALAALQERERLGRELHDELSQDLALINLQAQLVSDLLEAGQEEQAQKQLQILAKAARETQVDVRGEISRLSHSAVQEKGFLGALRDLIDTFQQTNGVEMELVAPQTVSLTPVVEVQLLRIVQEALTNIRKHAKAKQIWVTLTREPDCLKLTIEDDGIGFDPHSLLSSCQTFGLGIMSNRAEEVNGQVDVTSAPGKGTKVTVFVPEDSGR
jgi:signal transduction histidine kinase